MGNQLGRETCGEYVNLKPFHFGFEAHTTKKTPNMIPISQKVIKKSKKKKQYHDTTLLLFT